MTRKISEKQVQLLQRLMKEKGMSPDECMYLLKKYDIGKEEDIYQLDIFKASDFISELIKIKTPDRW